METDNEIKFLDDNIKSGRFILAIGGKGGGGDTSMPSSGPQVCHDHKYARQDHKYATLGKVFFFFLVCFFTYFFNFF